MVYNKFGNTAALFSVLHSYHAVCNWREKHPKFGTALARARADGAAKRFDQAVDRTWDADEREEAYCARVALMGAEAQAKAMNPKVYVPSAQQSLDVSVSIVSVLEVVEARRRALKDVTPMPVAIEKDNEPSEGE